MEQGKVWGAACLVTGCSIGAGMLGLPVLSAPVGFLPSVALFVIAWAFMLTTGLLLLEANLWFGKEAGIVTTARRTLGAWAAGLCWVLFLLLFYTAMTAFIVASGSIIHQISEQSLGYGIQNWMGSGLFVLFFVALIVVGTARVDRANRLLMACLLLTFLLLALVATKEIKLEHLEHRSWNGVALLLPVMIFSFGYHNLVPSLVYYLDADRTAIRHAIVRGTLLTLFIYLIWNGLILGILPPGAHALYEASVERGDLVTNLLAQRTGAWIAGVAAAFGFFSVVTTLLSVALSFVDFLADGLKVDRSLWKNRLFLAVLTLALPYLVACIYPTIFLRALRYAGAFCVVILFGAIPALMVWKGRYLDRREGAPLVGGGKATLVLVLLFSLAIFAQQLAIELGWG